MSARYAHAMAFGAQVTDSGLRFRLWAPNQRKVTLLLEDKTGIALPMTPQPDGWFELIRDDARAGSHYRYMLEDGTQVPDPASRFQPADVNGASEIIDPCAYAWTCEDWRGRPWHEVVCYEIHPGAFTPAGDYDAARRRLDQLCALGVSALELMPLSDFAGQRNWGYDGVLPFAPDASYGRPEDLKRLIDAAHAREIMVLLDVVYNHFGPSGNYLARYAPGFFTARYQTPWGEAIDFSRRAVRDFFIQNALYWLQEYRFDGLRLDAVDQIKDASSKPILEEIATTVRRTIPDRCVHLILENDDNAAHYLEREESPSNSPFPPTARGREGPLSPFPPTARGREERLRESRMGKTSSLPLAREAWKGELEGDSQPRFYAAQWNDDFHHAAHVIATGEQDGYYADYANNPVASLARALAEGFVYQGEYSGFRDRPRGESSAALPPVAFVNFLQNHDQIGNRARGKRLSMLAPTERLRALYPLLLLSPGVPLLFMGEEWAASTPFLFFCDFDRELNVAVREGRRNEFKRFAAYCGESGRTRIPDPTREQTFLRSRLPWAENGESPHVEWLAFITRLIALRHKELVPLLPCMQSGQVEFLAERAFVVGWPFADERCWRLAANLWDKPIQAPPCSGRVIYGQAPADTLAPWSLRVSCDE